MAKQRKRGGKVDTRTGRSKGEGRYVGLAYSMVTSDAFRSLSGTALKYYVEIRNRWDQQNNGQLHLSCGAAADLLGMSKATAMRAQRELIEKGFLVETRHGNWYAKEATTFALTDKPWPGNVPSHEYRNWRPKKRATVST